MFRLDVFSWKFVSRYILLLTKYSFDLPGTDKCIDRMEHFKSYIMMTRLKY